jgi:hypothetical protein
LLLVYSNLGGPVRSDSVLDDSACFYIKVFFTAGSVKSG